MQFKFLEQNFCFIDISVIFLWVLDFFFFFIPVSVYHVKLLHVFIMEFIFITILGLDFRYIDKSKLVIRDR
jgi:hypothetical protein